MGAVMKRLSIACLGLILVVAPLAAQSQKYGISVTADRKADFSAFKSYAWDVGQPALVKNVNQEIVAAVDRELKGLGLEQRASAPADVLVSYESQQRTDVNTKSKAPTTDTRLPEYAVGTLVVSMRQSGTGKEVFRARADKPIDIAPDKLRTIINDVVGEMFAKYPTRTQK